MNHMYFAKTTFEDKMKNKIIDYKMTKLKILIKYMINSSEKEMQLALLN